MMPPPILPGDLVRFQAGDDTTLLAIGKSGTIVGWGVVHQVAGGTLVVIVVDAIRPARNAGETSIVDRVISLRPEEVSMVTRGGVILYNMPPPNPLLERMI